MKFSIFRATLLAASILALVSCSSSDLTVQCQIEVGEQNINDGYEVLIDVVPWSRGLTNRPDASKWFEPIDGKKPDRVNHKSSKQLNFQALGSEVTPSGVHELGSIESFSGVSVFANYQGHPTEFYFSRQDLDDGGSDLIINLSNSSCDVSQEGSGGLLF
ncbi:MAG: hypothetical protein V3W41_00080 [Planctomycetota bacterium]